MSTGIASKHIQPCQISIKAYHTQKLISIPPKHAVASIIGFLKGKSTIAILRQFAGKQRNFTGEHFWTRGYAVSTVGFEKEQVQKYIREQEGFENSEGSF